LLFDAVELFGSVVINGEIAIRLPRTKTIEVHSVYVLSSNRSIPGALGFLTLIQALLGPDR
jgi:hypothetical protein